MSSRKIRGKSLPHPPGALSDAVAALGYALMVARSPHLSDKIVRDREWDKVAGLSLCGRSLRIIGASYIGKQ